MTLGELVHKLSELTLPGALVLCVALGCLAHVLRGFFSPWLDRDEGILGPMLSCAITLGMVWLMVLLIGNLRSPVDALQIRAGQPTVYVAQPQRAQPVRNCGCYEVDQ